MLFVPLSHKIHGNKVVSFKVFVSFRTPHLHHELNNKFKLKDLKHDPSLLPLDQREDCVTNSNQDLLVFYLSLGYVLIMILYNCTYLVRNE